MPVPQPLIAIAGSADSRRDDYEPPLRDAAAAHQLAEAIGAELARQGCRIIVYSNDPAFIDGDVVRGFVHASKKAVAGAIQVRFPYDSHAVRFPVPQGKEALFEYRTDTDRDWEASFFRSLRDAGGVILIGGGRSTFITGQVALAYGLPILAVARFGGAAEKVWRSLQPAKDLVTEAERNLMSHPDGQAPGAAGRLVGALTAQCGRAAQDRMRSERLERSRSRRLQFRAALAILLFLIALAAASLGFSATKGTGLLMAFLYGTGPIAGAAGSLLRSIWAPTETDRPAILTAAEGFGAGLAAAVLYLLAQISTAFDPGTISPIALLFAMAIGTIAGFTSDKVFRRIDKLEIDIQIPRFATRNAATNRAADNGSRAGSG